MSKEECQITNLGDQIEADKTVARGQVSVDESLTGEVLHTCCDLGCNVQQVKQLKNSVSFTIAVIAFPRGR